MKYYLLQQGHSDRENSLHGFDTKPERDAATIKAIFGADLSGQDEAEQWDKMREELNNRGTLTFEGDPSVEWFVANADSDGPQTAEAMFADKDRFVGYIADVVNPARLKEGLACISMEHAGACYSVLTERRYRLPKA